jgi:hypothetical protein
MEAFLTVRPGRAFGAHVASLLIAAMTVTAVIVPSPPAGAQGLFDFLFRGQRRPGPPANASPYADPSYPGFDRERGAGAPSGIAGTFCVRLCDGRYFPIQRSHGSNAAQLCNSFCPAAATKVFSGGGIDQASANDGTRYSGLPNAYVYRDKTVEGCTCNGRDAYGLVTLSADNDPTLRNGDIVATNQGFVAYSSGRRQQAEFTPIDPDARRRLSRTKIVPNATAAAPQVQSVPEVTGSTRRNRRVQLDR